MTPSDSFALPRILMYAVIIVLWLQVFLSVWRYPGNGARHVLLLMSAALVSWPVFLGGMVIFLINFGDPPRTLWLIPATINVVLVVLVLRGLRDLH